MHFSGERRSEAVSGETSLFQGRECFTAAQGLLFRRCKMLTLEHRCFAAVGGDGKLQHLSAQAGVEEQGRPREEDVFAPFGSVVQKPTMLESGGGVCPPYCAG